MSNPFYTRVFDVAPLTIVRSGPIEAEYDRIVAGFDGVDTKTTAALRAPDGEAPTTLPAVADRASKSLAFDASGNPIAVIAATSVEMEAAIAAATAADASADAAAISAATLAGSVNAIHLLQLQVGIQ